MKKAVYIAFGVLLCLFWLAACGKGGTAETSGTIEARPGGCYLMTEETPDEICGDAKKIFSENLESWVSVSNGGAGNYMLGSPYHTQPLDASGDPFDCYHFSVLRDGTFWGALSVYEAYGETTFQFSPPGQSAQAFEQLRGLSSPEHPIRFVWVGDVRYAVVGDTAVILTHEGGEIPENIEELALQNDLPDSAVVDISKPIAALEISAS